MLGEPSAVRLLILIWTLLAVIAVESLGRNLVDLREAHAREALVEEARRLFHRELGEGAEAAMDGLTENQIIQQGIAFRQNDKVLLIDITNSRIKRIEAIVMAELDQQGDAWEDLELYQRVLAELKEDLERFSSDELPLLTESDIDNIILEKREIARFEALRGKWNASLVEAISGCDRIRFLATGFHYTTDEGKELYQKIADEIVNDFISRTQVLEPSDHLHCMCAGDFQMEFYRGDNLKATLSFHHGKLLRWIDGAWTSDAELTLDSGLALRKWVSEIGYPGLVDFGE